MEMIRPNKKNSSFLSKVLEKVRILAEWQFGYYAYFNSCNCVLHWHLEPKNENVNKENYFYMGLVRTLHITYSDNLCSNLGSSAVRIVKIKRKKNWCGRKTGSRHREGAKVFFTWCSWVITNLRMLQNGNKCLLMRFTMCWLTEPFSQYYFSKSETVDLGRTEQDW